jgi:hypothetical protein
VNSRFRGKQFKIFDFIRWYSIEREDCKGYFSYHQDWAGFNIPSHVFEEVYNKSQPPDINDYDLTMIEIYETLRRLEDNNKFYVIGATDLGQTFDHEIAHAIFYIDEEYKNLQLQNVASLQHDIVQSLRRVLMKEGYVEDVLDDEIQAYLSTGVGGSIEACLLELGYEDEYKMELLLRPFRDTYRRFNLATEFKRASLRPLKKQTRGKKRHENKAH